MVHTSWMNAHWIELLLNFNFFCTLSGLEGQQDLIQDFHQHQLQLAQLVKRGCSAQFPTPPELQTRACMHLLLWQELFGLKNGYWGRKCKCFNSSNESFGPYQMRYLSQRRKACRVWPLWSQAQWHAPRMLEDVCVCVLRRLSCGICVMLFVWCSRVTG